LEIQIEDEREQKKFEKYLKKNKVTGWKKDRKGNYFQEKQKKDTKVEKIKYDEENVTSEILAKMMISGKKFKAKDNKFKNLKNHIKAREAIIAFAEKKNYDFDAGAGTQKLNPEYWEQASSGDWSPKNGNWKAALNDINKNPDEYTLACNPATMFTLLGGVVNAGGKGTDFSVHEDNVVIPGDAVFVENTKYDGKIPGRQGENLIYMGKAKGGVLGALL
jgi:hypothetical protein